MHAGWCMHAKFCAYSHMCPHVTRFPRFSACTQHNLFLSIHIFPTELQKPSILHLVLQFCNTDQMCGSWCGYLTRNAHLHRFLLSASSIAFWWPSNRDRRARISILKILGIPCLIKRVQELERNMSTLCPQSLSKNGFLYSPPLVGTCRLRVEHWCE